MKMFFAKRAITTLVVVIAAVSVSVSEAKDAVGEFSDALTRQVKAKKDKKNMSKNSKGAKGKPKMKDLYGCKPDEMAYFHHWLSAFYGKQNDASEEIVFAGGPCCDYSGPKVAAFYEFVEEYFSPDFEFIIDNFIYNQGNSPTKFLEGIPNSFNYETRDSFLYGGDYKGAFVFPWLVIASTFGTGVQNINGLVTYPECDRETGTVVVNVRGVDFTQGFGDFDNNDQLESNIGLSWGAAFTFEPDENNELVCMRYAGKASVYATLEYNGNLDANLQ